MLRILVADDHDVMRLGIRVLLAQRPDWEVCDEAATGLEAVSKTEQQQPDVLILDIGMPELDGLEASKQIRKISPNTEILILSMHYSDQLTRDIVNLGIRGYVVKSDSDCDLVAAVQNLAKHKPFFSQHASEAICGFFNSVGPVGKIPDKIPERLTLREREIVGYLTDGLRAKKIATLLGISVKTVDTHRSNVMRKLDIHTIVDLVRYAVRNEIVKP